MLSDTHNASMPNLVLILYAYRCHLIYVIGIQLKLWSIRQTYTPANFIGKKVGSTRKWSGRKGEFRGVRAEKSREETVEMNTRAEAEWGCGDKTEWMGSKSNRPEVAAAFA